MSDESSIPAIEMSNTDEHRGLRASSRFYGGLSSSSKGLRLTGSLPFRQASCSQSGMDGDGIFINAKSSEHDNNELSDAGYTGNSTITRQLSGGLDDMSNTSTENVKMELDRRLSVAVYRNFCFMSILFSAVPAAALACLSLATAELGELGMMQSGPTYVAEAADEYAHSAGIDRTESTGYLSGIFAFVLLIEETTLDLLSTVLVRGFSVPWVVVFFVYFTAAVAAIGLMIFIKEYPSCAAQQQRNGIDSGQRACYNVTTTLGLLVNDSKMKYMIGLNVAFGFSGAFLDSFVNGEVVPIALHDSKASLVGLLVAVHGGAAAVASLGFGYLSRITGKGPILYFGAVCFAWVVAPFLIQPNIEKWDFAKLLGVYCLQGIGRATFEGTLKAVFADYFYYEKEGAYANIVLQNGISGAVAYLLSARLTCRKVSTYCMEYRDGSLHSVGTFGMCVLLASILGIAGFARASYLHRTRGHHQRLHQESRSSLDTRQYSDMIGTEGKTTTTINF
ncbi:hypothetical protein ACA910_017515 [Epithemia clementina (nom. ined.)]